MDFLSTTLGSEVGATLLSEEDEDEEEERYAVVSKNLCGFEYTPGHSTENLDGSGKFDTYTQNVLLQNMEPDNHYKNSL